MLTTEQFSNPVPPPPLPPPLPRSTLRRTWPAILLLLFLPGITAEMLTGSTPVIVYLTIPFFFIANTLLYGSGAILIREVTRRRNLGWSSILLLGAAYGVFEEGLVINTWANPWLPQVCQIVKGKASGICDYSRVGGINLSWAASLTFFHAIVSITIPILLVELVFPRRAILPWLGRKAPFVFAGIEILILAFGLLYNVASYHQHYLAGPPAGPYLVEIILMSFFIVLALNIKPNATVSPSRSAPRLWTLRAFGFFTLFITDLLPYIANGMHMPFGIELALNGLLLVFVIWRMATWTRRNGWNDRHMLALAAGALGFFLVIWDPILELLGSAGGKPTHGALVVALAYLIFLILLARRTARRITRSQVKTVVTSGV